MGFVSNIGEYFESGARKILPYTLMILLLLLNSVSVPFLMTGDIKAPLFLMGLYYWSIYRPTLVSPWIAFTSGIVADLLGGLPLGLNATIFVIVQWIVSDQRRFLMGQSFVMIWFGFLVLSLLTGLLEWMVFGLVSLDWPNPKPMVLSVLLGLAFFPLVWTTLHWTHRFLPSPAGSLERS